MKSQTRIILTSQIDRKRDWLDAAEGMPNHHKAALVSRIMKEVVAGRITAAEAIKLSRTGKR
ncbi:MAG TPA: hypothetical protein DDY39_14455 [Nitrospira sp.]|nr:hypothetical protein [Nitrospira sp.]HBR50363.1 hypothetical protein [Nitrospira sp.]